MANAGIDANTRATATGVSSSDSSVVLPLRCDPATSRLLIDISIIASSSPPAAHPTVDANTRAVASAVTDDAAATIEPLRCVAATGYLLVDIA